MMYSKDMKDEEDKKNNIIFNNKILIKSDSNDRYLLYKAALEWDLIEPIIIASKDDIKSKQKWHDRVEPYHHQVKNLIIFCRRLPVTLISDDVGLGKTISAGLIVSELLWRSRIFKILIVCPKILREQWKEELGTKFDISSKIITGRELLTIDDLKQDYSAFITTYNTARLYLEEIETNQFDMLILDEAHKLRNLYGVDKPPEVARKFHKALQKRLFNYVLMLTATPIQNRLWDLYSLIEMLTVARGHTNPLGKSEFFAKKFIGDGVKSARKLNPDKQEEFRSILYGYISRTRRKDANLSFPDRVVQSHLVSPDEQEKNFINSIVGCINKIESFLIKVTLLQLLISSPEALEKTVKNMQGKGTLSPKISEKILNSIKQFLGNVNDSQKNVYQLITNGDSETNQVLIPHENCQLKTAKMRGLVLLIGRLKADNPNNWRIVVFTRWRETQTSIACVLAKENISYGLINGDSAQRNQDTLEKFRKKPIPEVNVIVSTEAGSEGINLQVANVIVNYDLPWNPMIIEQRIGRVQRLFSDHANVCIFNIMIKDTFEEYIVGRLMEKLQLASHAIGDVESLLETSGIGDGEDNEECTSFEKHIAKLVIASIAGQNKEEALRKTEKSIADAKVELQREEENINNLLGDSDDYKNYEPMTPKFSEITKSMSCETFISKASKLMPNDASQIDLISDSNSKEFKELIKEILRQPLHNVYDTHNTAQQKVNAFAKNWLDKFEANLQKINIEETYRCFSGVVTLNVRVTVAHDSYERIIDINCKHNEHYSVFVGKSGIEPIKNYIDEPDKIGISQQKLLEEVNKNKDIAEFCRFYIERREMELTKIENDVRKQKKLVDDFTPRLTISLVGLEGDIVHIIKSKIYYSMCNSNAIYSSNIKIDTFNDSIVAPDMVLCHITNRSYPHDCVSKCEITNNLALTHLLSRSQISNRLSLSDYIVKCEVSGKSILQDETEKSFISGKIVAKNLINISAISGKKAEFEYFTKCDFTNADILISESRISHISEKRYRTDEEERSVVSGKTGHKSEFIYCHETKQPLLELEADRCELSGYLVKPGILQQCEITGKLVVPLELETSCISGKLALKSLFVSSSISGKFLIRDESIISSTGTFCTPEEGISCMWSGSLSHPDDIGKCSLTLLPIHKKYLTKGDFTYLETLFNLLDHISHKQDKNEIWISIISQIEGILQCGKLKINAAELSPDNNKIALSIEARTWVGFRVKHIGLLYSLEDGCLVGKCCIGKFSHNHWRLLIAN
ncbi:MAG: DEAD/DEAH box helicase [Gammaproteobacteria bacterium]|nr:MAG: DEAD/DEAH box helicase [Gammaproteobacteria bacterium]